MTRPYQRVELASAALGGKAQYDAYLPDRPGRWPVLFVLHGVDSAFSDWTDHAAGSLQQLASEHGLILITPEGGRDGWYVDSEREPGRNYASHLLYEVLPDVDARLPVDRRRAVTGQSAGGHGAITLALAHPELFSSASSMSGVLDLSAARDRHGLQRSLGPYEDDPALWERHSARHLVAREPDRARRLPLRITVGSADRWAPVNRAFAEQLHALGVPHEFEETPGGHDWQFWTSQLAEHVAFHVRALSARAPA